MLKNSWTGLVSEMHSRTVYTGESKSAMGFPDQTSHERTWPSLGAEIDQGKEIVVWGRNLTRK